MSTRFNKKTILTLASGALLISAMIFLEGKYRGLATAAFLIMCIWVKDKTRMTAVFGALLIGAILFLEGWFRVLVLAAFLIWWVACLPERLEKILAFVRTGREKHPSN